MTTPTWTCEIHAIKTLRRPLRSQKQGNGCEIEGWHLGPQAVGDLEQVGQVLQLPAAQNESEGRWKG